MSFTTPLAGPSGIALKFQLTVDDGYGGTASDEMAINVTHVNQLPTADAGFPHTVGGLATALNRQGQGAEAETLQRQALAIQRVRFGNEHPEVASTLNNLALALQAHDKLDEAEEVHREGLAMSKKLLGNDHPRVATSLTNLAGVLQRQGQLDEAERMYREAVAMQRKLLGSEHPDVGGSLNILAMLIENDGRYTEAEPLHREVLAMCRKLLETEHPSVPTALENLARVLEKQGKRAEVNTLFREDIAIARQSKTKDQPGFERRLLSFAERLYRQGEYAEAEPLYREVIESRQARLAPDDGDLLGSIASLGRLLADRAWTERTRSADPRSLPTGNGLAGTEPAALAPHERAKEAERLPHDCLIIRLRGPNATHWRSDEIRSRLGGAMLAAAVTAPALTSDSRLAKFAEAELLLLEANEALQRSERTERKYKRDAITRLVRLYEAWDQPNKVAEWRQKLADFDELDVNQ